MRLASFLRERWRLVEADFQRFYGLDLRHEVQRTPLRRVCALVTGLPPEAVCWKQETVMWERFDAWMHILARLSGMKQDVLPPLELTNPRYEPEKRRKSTPQEIAAFFRNMQQGGGNAAGTN